MIILHAKKLIKLIAIIALCSNQCIFAQQIPIFKYVSIRSEDNRSVPIGNVKFSLDGKKILILSAITGSVLESQNGKELTKLNFPAPGNYTIGGEFSHDGQYIITGHMDREFIVWNSNNGVIISDEYTEKVPYSDSNNVWSVSLSFDNNIAAALCNANIYLLDIRKGRLLKKFAGNGYPIFVSNNMLFLGNDFGNCMLYNIETGEIVKKFVGTPRLSPDKKKIFEASDNPSEIKVWDINANKYVKSFIFKSATGLSTFSSDGMFFMIENENSIDILNKQEDGILKKLKSFYKKDIQPSASNDEITYNYKYGFNPEGKMIYIVAQDIAYFFDIADLYSNTTIIDDSK